MLGSLQEGRPALPRHAMRVKHAVWNSISLAEEKELGKKTATGRQSSHRHLPQTLRGVCSQKEVDLGGFPPVENDLPNMSEIDHPTHAQGRGSFKRSRHFVEGVCRTSNVLIVCSFVFFFAFVLVSNDFDWDHFLSAAEVERRSWLLNLELPLWSYQFCGGVTRAGDPQSFGLSPLFLPILMFGSFWGLKLLILALAMIGFLALRGILRLFLQVETGIRRRRPVETALIQVVSLSFVLGNYFVWHFHEGHVSFAQNYIILGVLYFLVKALFDSFSARDAIAAGLLSFSFFSGALYHSIVFFLVPLAFSSCIFAIAIVFARSWAGRLRLPVWGRISAALGATCIGLSAAVYKPYFVLTYQKQFPRVLHDSPAEPSSLKQWLVYQLAPTLDNKFGGFFRGWGPWGTWEYSAFTINAWICIIGLLAFSYRRTASIRRLLIFAASLVMVGGLFAIGDNASLSLHRLINIAADHSIRVIGRYQIIFSLAFACLAAALLHASRRLRRWTFAYGCCAVPLLLSLNFLSFRLTLRPDSLWSILSYVH